MPTNAVNSVVVQTATIVNQTVNTNTQPQVVATAPKKKKKKKSTKEKKPRPKPGEIRLTTALGKNIINYASRSGFARVLCGY
jgi:hypothetical protein